MNADKALFQHVARGHGQQRRTTAFRQRVVRWWIQQAFLPNITFVPCLSGQPVSTHKRRRHSPQTTLQLAESLGHPTRERQVVPAPKYRNVVIPKAAGGDQLLIHPASMGWARGGAKFKVYKFAFGQLRPLFIKWP